MDADTADLQDGPVRGLGQRLVQRRVRVLAGAGAGEPLQINGAGLPGILMLQGTLDAATPYAGAQDAHKLLPSARMVVVEGSGHQAVVRAAFEPLRAGLPERLSGHRGAAGGPGAGQRHLPGRARPDTRTLMRNFLWYCPV